VVFGFRCSFRVSIEAFARSAVRTAAEKVGRIALLSAWVKAYKTSSLGEPDASPALSCTEFNIAVAGRNE